MILAAMLFVCIMGCNDELLEEPLQPDSVTNEEAMPWHEVLFQLDLDSDMLFVQEGESIQEAIDAASSGTIIYIEPGNYPEKLSLSNSDVQLIGVSTTASDFNITGLENEPNVISLNDDDSSTLKGKSTNHGKKSCIRDFSRTDLGRGIAHYQFEVTMGSGEYDVVRIHRVVREKRPYQPVRTKGDVFMVHGAIQDFDDIFLIAGAETINAKTSAPFYLASKNIDVWGIDMGWTMVPEKPSDFLFMEDWGIEKDVSHTLKAMSIARLIRGLTRQGFSRMNLLGFSYGVTIAYGAANRETQQHCFWRDVKGIIPVDNAMKTENPDVHAFSCARADELMGLIQSGQFNDPWGVGLIVMGNLALSDPDGESPFNPDLTNSQFLAFVGSQGFHAIDQDGNYLHTDQVRFFRLVANLSPHWPNQVVYDMRASICPSLEVSHDAYLHEISLPIFYIGAEVATGTAGIYTSSLTASNDITNLIVPGYSHADLWLGHNADQLVWDPLRNWIVNHR
jgi:pimeloyl-ACP methyl ester carboxylesterase